MVATLKQLDDDMYLDYFQFQHSPFQLTPDTKFFYQFTAHKEALDVLSVAIKMGEGFIKVTGEVGTGKTLLCHQLINFLDESYYVAHLSNPYLNRRSLQFSVAEELGLSLSDDTPDHQLIKQIKLRLIELRCQNKKPVLIIDEAQSIPESGLESLRLLTNLETEKTKLIQVVLIGQPELNNRLNQPAIRQLTQRITFSYILYPMDKKSVELYIQHRLFVSGYCGAPLFNNRALQQIFKISRGVPRLINVLSHKALLLAYGSGVRKVSSNHIRLAAKDTEIFSEKETVNSQFSIILLGFASTLALASTIALFMEIL
jgi:MSHA biogenesis protein MshM